MAKLIFVTRGHGFGHAARDLLIIEQLRVLRPDLEIVIASSGTGLAYYRARGVTCHDLDIPDADDMSKSAGGQVWNFLRTMTDASLVVSDEVLWAIPISRRLLKLRSVLLTNWFYDDGAANRVLNGAEEVVVLDFPEVHRPPAELTAPIHFAGPLCRMFSIDRRSARRRVGLDADRFLTVVSLGGVVNRPAAVRIVQRVLSAWARYAGRSDELVFLADPPERVETPAGAAGKSIHWAGPVAEPDVYHRAADVVVADGRGFTPCELAFNGVPVVADMAEPIDRMNHERARVLQRSGLVTAMATQGTPKELWCQLRLVSETVPSPAAADRLLWASSREQAVRLLGHLGDGGRSAHA